MFGLNKISGAVTKLVTSIHALAATTAEINDALRSQLHLDGKPARKVLASPEEGNGKVARKAKEVIG